MWSKLLLLKTIYMSQKWVGLTKNNVLPKMFQKDLVETLPEVGLFSSQKIVFSLVFRQWDRNYEIQISWKERRQSTRTSAHKAMQVNYVRYISGVLKKRIAFQLWRKFMKSYSKTAHYHWILAGSFLVMRRSSCGRSLAPVLECFFNKVAGFQAWNYIKKRLKHRCLFWRTL